MLTGPSGSRGPRDSPLCVGSWPGKSPGCLCQKQNQHIISICKPGNHFWRQTIKSQCAGFAYQVAASVPFSVARSECCCQYSFRVGDPAALGLWKQGTLAGSWHIPFLARYPGCHIFRWLKTSLWNSEKWREKSLKSQLADGKLRLFYSMP